MWLIALVTGGGLISLDIMYVAFINYHNVGIAQIIDHKIRPYDNCSQPRGTWIAIYIQTAMLFTYGYYAFHSWGVKAFFQNYKVQIVDIVLYLGRKLFRRQSI
jgi:amino acid permease